jgi:hypothetical protein
MISVIVARQPAKVSTHRILILNDNLQIRLVGCTARHALLASLHILPDLIVVPVIAVSKALSTATASRGSLSSVALQPRELRT